MTYTETDLIIPVLNLLFEADAYGLTTTVIKETLLEQLELSDDDLRILAGRNDSHFSQQVRNLVSHDTLTRKGLATYEATKPSGTFYITGAGKAYLQDHTGDFDFISSSGFTEAQRKEVIEHDYKDLIIEEGHFIPANQPQKRKRSRKLTEEARKYYTVDGKISCAGCNFNFNDFYGDTAKSYIEIHHLKPIHTYEGADTSKSLQEALQNVRPLCSNCHRMAHRDSKNLLNDTDIRSLVLNNGVFDIPKQD